MKKRARTRRRVRKRCEASQTIGAGATYREHVSVATQQIVSLEPVDKVRQLGALEHCPFERGIPCVACDSPTLLVKNKNSTVEAATLAAEKGQQEVERR